MRIAELALPWFPVLPVATRTLNRAAPAAVPTPGRTP